MTYQVKSPKKLIEVALPLDAINEACAYEKMPGIGAHPRGIHLWWARRPLAAARAVIFAQLVNDPSWKWEMENPGQVAPAHLKASWAASRKRLFAIIEELVKWENTTNEEVLERARAEIRRSWREVCELNKDHPQAAELFNPERLPALHDPFAGGGAIPLEAQRLGLEAYASDLNPVAVLINKAMIEIPPRFAGRAPVGPLPKGEKQTSFPREWPGATGLAEDVRRYGAWIREEAEKRIGHLYPKVEITAEMAHERPDLKPLVGQRLTVVAWLWVRTVKSPNPAFSHVDVPLASTFVLCSNKGRDVYVQPVLEGQGYHFSIRSGTPPEDARNGTRARDRGAEFRCLVSGSPISADYVRSEARAGRMGKRLMAIVAKGVRGRVYLQPTCDIEEIESNAQPVWKPDIEFFQQALGFRVGNYGMTKWSDLFTSRQLVLLTTLCDLISQARAKIHKDAVAAGMQTDPLGVEAGGAGAIAYSEAVSLFLAFAVDRCADFSNALTRWVPGNQKVMNLFGRQTVSMTWDHPEANALADTVGGIGPAVEYIADCVTKLPATTPGVSVQTDAQHQTVSCNRVISTDPPYYDNIGYADLSDFFYVWLRQTQRSVFPSLFSTVVVPKMEELVATPGRHGTKERAEMAFLEGMTEAIERLAEQAHPEAPVTVYYAFKQTETEREKGTSSSGWETFLAATLQAGFAIVGTWPLRSEQEYRMRGMNSNALASSIVLVCRKRVGDAPTVSRREFLRELNAVLPEALDEMTRGSGEDRSPVAPVDLSQAIIGPGMAVFSKYAAVLEADGTPMSVRTALQLINRFLVEDDFDADTQFCLHWFEQNGWRESAYGQADVLARAKGTSVDGMRDAGVVESGGGIVRLRKWSEYPAGWDPRTDSRNPVWETLHHLIRALKREGETGAGALLAGATGKAEAVRQLAYRLYTLCERKGWAEDARAYNELITSWAGIEAAAGSEMAETQGRLFD